MVDHCYNFLQVHPTLQGWGIDKKIVQRIIRFVASVHRNNVGFCGA